VEIMTRIQIPHNFNTYSYTDLLPMAKAPKDGKPFLVWYQKGRNKKYPRIARWEKAWGQYQFDCGTTLIPEIMEGWMRIPFRLADKHQPKA
jgi:hypothetical protein